jgi:hypothetical protein
MHSPPLTPKCQRFEPTAMHYTTIDSKNVRDSTTRPCTTPPLTPKNERFKHTTMHYTIEPKKAKIRTHDHALHHQWPTNVRDLNPQTHDHALHHYWPPKSLSFDHALHHHWPSKRQDSNPRPCTPSMHYTTIEHEGRRLNIGYQDMCTCTLIRFLDHIMQLVGFKLTWPPFSTHSCNPVYCHSYPTHNKQTSSRLFHPFKLAVYILHV